MHASKASSPLDRTVRCERKSVAILTSSVRWVFAISRYSVSYLDFVIIRDGDQLMARRGKGQSIDRHTVTSNVSDLYRIKSN